MTGYAEAHGIYRAAGWRSPLPLPPGAKWPPPEGYTGWHGLDPSGADSQAWCDDGQYVGTSQLALRMPVDIIGLDVDHYGDKRGGDTIAHAEKLWGPLPDAPYSSARGRGPSGIRFFGVEAGTHLRTVLRFASEGLGHVEIIQRHHRYAVCWPSIHPNGDPYLWYNTAGHDVPARVQAILARAMLPTAWIENLRGADEPGVAEATPEQVTAFNMAHVGSTRLQALAGVEKVLAGYLAGGMARHDAFVTVACMAARESVLGYYPALDAMARLRRAFVDAMRAAIATPRLPSERAMHVEFGSVWAWAVSQAMAETDASLAERARGTAERQSGMFAGDRYTGQVERAPAPDAPNNWEKSVIATPRENPQPNVTQGETLAPSTVDQAAASVPVAPPPLSLVPTIEQPVEDQRAASSWRPIDLAAEWDVEVPDALPTMLIRTDGPALIYPGETHSIYGESESGKSWVAMVAVAERLAAREDVLYIDHESDKNPVKARLKLLGVTAEQAKRLTYVRPEGPRDSAWFDLIEGQTYSLAVIDGVSVAIATDGGKSNDTDETVAWLENVPRAIQRETGAAVLTIDHVTKSRDGRGRFAVGSQAKLNAITGAAYTARVHVPFGRGQIGELVLRLTKDRPGGIRPHCGPAGEHGTQEACRVVLDSTDPRRIVVTLKPWSPEGSEETDLPFGDRPERATSWRETAVPLPGDVAEYGGAGASSIRDLARFMRHAADGGVGQSLADAKTALRDVLGIDGKPVHNRWSVQRAWGALSELDRIAPVSSSGATTGHSVWVAKSNDPVVAVPALRVVRDAEPVSGDDE